ncbi:hypothetical protein V2K78_14105, partial [Pseudomonas alliivorans]|nr:hypothetical protein [Pseudomonas alliivorans]MEE4701257.1 hypothetical protein [Pseudomonas alliivorans]
KKLCGNGLTGLCHAVFETVLFVQSLEGDPGAPALWFSRQVFSDGGAAGDHKVPEAWNVNA